MKLRTALAALIIAGLAFEPAGVFAVIPPPKPNPLAPQVKAVNQARIKMEQAQGQFLVIRKKIEIVFEAKPDWKAAKDALDKAKAEYDAAGRKVAASLESVPAYKALMVKRDKAQSVIDAATNPQVASAADDVPKVTNEDLTSATNDHRDAVVEMKKMEKDVEDADPNYAVLKQKYDDARAAWDAMQMEVDAAVKLDPAYPAAQQAVDQAEAAYKQAREQLAAAAKSIRDAAAAAARAKARSGGR